MSRDLDEDREPAVIAGWVLSAVAAHDATPGHAREARQVAQSLGVPTQAVIDARARLARGRR